MGSEGFHLLVLAEACKRKIQRLICCFHHKNVSVTLFVQNKCWIPLSYFMNKDLLLCFEMIYFETPVREREREFLIHMSTSQQMQDMNFGPRKHVAIQTIARLPPNQSPRAIFVHTWEHLRYTRTGFLFLKFLLLFTIIFHSSVVNSYGRHSWKIFFQHNIISLCQGHEVVQRLALFTYPGLLPGLSWSLLLIFGDSRQWLEDGHPSAVLRLSQFHQPMP